MIYAAPPSFAASGPTPGGPAVARRRRQRLADAERCAEPLPGAEAEGSQVALVGYAMLWDVMGCYGMLWPFMSYQ